jgi:Flp pilus assembly pilin Flp
MPKLCTRLRLPRHGRDRGATAVEYALIVAVIAMVVAFAGLALAGALSDSFNDASACLRDLDDCP